MKTTFPKLFAATALAAIAFALPAQAASAAADKVELLRDANKAVSDLHRDPAFATARSAGPSASRHSRRASRPFTICTSRPCR